MAWWSSCWPFPLKKTCSTSYPPIFSLVILPTHFSYKLFLSLHLQCHKIQPSSKVCSLDSLFKCTEWQCSHIPIFISLIQWLNCEDREVGNFWDVFSKCSSVSLCLCRTLAHTFNIAAATVCHCHTLLQSHYATLCICAQCATLPLFHTFTTFLPQFLPHFCSLHNISFACN